MLILPFLNNPKRSRSVLQDGSRSLGLFWKDKTPSYNRRNTVRVIMVIGRRDALNEWSEMLGYGADGCTFKSGFGQRATGKLSHSPQQYTLLQYFTFPRINITQILENL